MRDANVKREASSPGRGAWALNMKHWSSTSLFRSRPRPMLIHAMPSTWSYPHRDNPLPIPTRTLSISAAQRCPLYTPPRCSSNMLRRASFSPLPGELESRERERGFNLIAHQITRIWRRRCWQSLIEPRTVSAARVVRLFF